MTTIIAMAATLVPVSPLIKKNSGTPTSAPPPKHMSCRFVRLNRTLVLTLVKSWGMVTYAMVGHLDVWALFVIYVLLFEDGVRLLSCS